MTSANHTFTSRKSEREVLMLFIAYPENYLPLLYKRHLSLTQVYMYLRLSCRKHFHLSNRFCSEIISNQRNRQYPHNSILVSYLFECLPGYRKGIYAIIL